MYMFGEAQLYFYDYRCDDVLDSIYNYIHNEEYVDGFNVFVNKLNTYYEQGKLDNYEIDENGHVHEIVVEEEYSTPLGVMALIGGIVEITVFKRLHIGQKRRIIACQILCHFFQVANQGCKYSVFHVFISFSLFYLKARYGNRSQNLYMNS